LALEYATTLTVVDASSGVAASLADVVALVGDWAGIDSLEPDDREAEGRNSSRVVTRLLDSGDRDRWAWTLTMDVTNEDRSGELVDWQATVSVIESQSTRVAIHIERTARSEILRPLETRPRPPRLVANLIRTSHFRVVDGGVALLIEPGALAIETMDEFVLGLLLGPNRRLPVIGISQPRYGVTERIDAARIADELIGLAHVWAIPAAVTWELSKALTPRLSVYNGAARVWWPGFALSDDPYDHPLWLPRAPLRRIEDEIVELVLDTAGTRFAQPSEVRELDDVIRQRRDAQLRAELDELMELATRPSERSALDVEEERRRLEASVRERVRDLETERDRALDEAIHYEQDRDRLVKENAQLLGEVRGLRARAGYWETEAEEEAGDRSPEEELLADVVSEYETRFTAADRERYALAPISLGASFLATLEQSDVPRAKVVQVLAEIACRRAREIPGRQVHPLRESEGPSSPQRRRARDGAEAWRCHLENRTPQAARLHWWAIGEAIEFAAVVKHDDFDIPE
jgi:hypothetical protein